MDRGRRERKRRRERGEEEEGGQELGRTFTGARKDKGKNTPTGRTSGVGGEFFLLPIRETSPVSSPSPWGFISYFVMLM